MENKIIIGKKVFKNAEEFKDYANEAMNDFLENIQSFPQYIELSDEDSLFAYEEGIEFTYTRIGSDLVHRWIRRMEAIFEKYFPDDYGFEPRCTYYRTF